MCALSVHGPACLCTVMRAGRTDCNSICAQRLRWFELSGEYPGGCRRLMRSVQGLTGPDRAWQYRPIRADCSAKGRQEHKSLRVYEGASCAEGAVRRAEGAGRMTRYQWHPERADSLSRYRFLFRSASGAATVLSFTLLF